MQVDYKEGLRKQLKVFNQLRKTNKVSLRSWGTINSVYQAIAFADASDNKLPKLAKDMENILKPLLTPKEKPSLDKVVTEIEEALLNPFNSCTSEDKEHILMVRLKIGASVLVDLPDLERAMQISKKIADKEDIRVANWLKEKVTFFKKPEEQFLAKLLFNNIKNNPVNTPLVVGAIELIWGKYDAN